MLCEVMAFLPGNFIVQKMAVACKRLRKISMILGPLSDDRVVTLKVNKQEKQAKSFIFLAKKEEDVGMHQKQGINLHAYRTLMRFANHI